MRLFSCRKITCYLPHQRRYKPFHPVLILPKCRVEQNRKWWTKTLLSDTTFDNCCVAVHTLLNGHVIRGRELDPTFTQCPLFRQFSIFATDDIPKLFTHSCSFECRPVITYQGIQPICTRIYVPLLTNKIPLFFSRPEGHCHVNVWHRVESIKTSKYNCKHICYRDRISKNFFFPILYWHVYNYNCWH